MEYALINVTIAKPLTTPPLHANPNVPPPRNGTLPHNHARTSLVAALSISTQAQSPAKTAQPDATIAATHTVASPATKTKP